MGPQGSSPFRLKICLVPILLECEDYWARKKKKKPFWAFPLALNELGHFFYFPLVQAFCWRGIICVMRPRCVTYEKKKPWTTSKALTSCSSRCKEISALDVRKSEPGDCNVLVTRASLWIRVVAWKINSWASSSSKAWQFSHAALQSLQSDLQRPNS